MAQITFYSAQLYGKQLRIILQKFGRKGLWANMYQNIDLAQKNLGEPQNSPSSYIVCGPKYVINGAQNILQLRAMVQQRPVFVEGFFPSQCCAPSFNRLLDTSAFTLQNAKPDLQIRINFVVLLLLFSAVLFITQLTST